MLPAVGAARKDIYFTAINDELLPLKDETMPKYIGGELYLPFTLFSAEKLGIYFITSGDLNSIMLYSGSKRLIFTVSTGETFDQDQQQHFFSAQAVNGTVYLPAQKVCDYFGLTLSIIEVYQVPIIRVTSSSAVLNELTFPYYSQTKADAQQYYNDYMGVNESPGPGIPPSPGVSTPPSPPVSINYERITVYPFFYKFTDGMLGKALALLDKHGYQGTLFVAGDEVAGNADLLRKAAGEGHSIGIWLTTGTYDEYLDTAGLLYEAAKVRTLLVAAPAGSASAASKAAGEHGLIYWRPTKRYDGTAKISVSTVTSGLSVIEGSRDSLCFACTKASLQTVDGVLQYFKNKNYNVRKIVETSIPIPSA